MYSKQLLEHFQNPRNVGELGPPAITVEVMNPACGDIMRLAARVEDGRIEEGAASRLPGDMLLTGINAAASLELQAPDRILDDLQARSSIDGSTDVLANGDTTLQVTGAVDLTATEINLGLNGADLLSSAAGRIESARPRPASRRRWRVEW